MAAILLYMLMVQTSWNITVPDSHSSDVLLPGYSIGARPMKAGESGVSLGLLNSRWTYGLGNGSEWGFQNLLIPGLFMTAVGFAVDDGDPLARSVLILLGLGALIPQPYYKILIDSDPASGSYLALVASLSMYGGVYLAYSKYGPSQDIHLKGGWGGAAYPISTGPFVSAATNIHLSEAWSLYAEARFDVGPAPYSDEDGSDSIAVQGFGYLALRIKGESVYFDIGGGVVHSALLDYVLNGHDPGRTGSEEYQTIPLAQLALGWDF